MKDIVADFDTNAGGIVEHGNNQNLDFSGKVVEDGRGGAALTSLLVWRRWRAWPRCSRRHDDALDEWECILDFALSFAPPGLGAAQYMTQSVAF